MSKNVIALSLCFLGASAWAMELQLSTSKPDAKTTLKMGSNSKFPDEIVASVKNPDVKKVDGSVAFGGYQFYQTVGSLTNRLKKDDTDPDKLDEANLCVSKAIFKNIGQQKMLDAFVAAGGKVYTTSQTHDKSFVFKRADSVPLEAFLTSANLSKRANNENHEFGLRTTDSPVKQDILSAMKRGFDLGNVYDGKGVAPDTPDTLKQKRAQSFRSHIIPDTKDKKLPVVFSSDTHDIESFRLDKLKAIEGSKADKKEVYFSTMTIGPTMLDALTEAAKSDVKINLVIDKSGVTKANEAALRSLASQSDAVVLVNTASGSIHHSKFMGVLDGQEAFVEASTQNNAGGNKTKSGKESKGTHSGDEFNISLFSKVDTISPVKKSFGDLSTNPRYVPFSPTATRYHTACPPKKPKKKKTIEATTTTTTTTTTATTATPAVPKSPRRKVAPKRKADTTLVNPMAKKSRARKVLFDEDFFSNGSDSE